MVAAVAAAVILIRSRAVVANLRTICGVMACWTDDSSIAAARSASACAWSRIALRMVTRSFSAGSSSAATPASIAS
jgi:hypothetical protein